jgi:hypothetical protein
MCVIHKYVPQINIVLMAFLKNLSYDKNIVNSSSLWTEPHLIIFHFILYILY